MIKLTIILLSVAALISFTQCSNSTSDKLCSNADTRGKIISELMNNDADQSKCSMMMGSMQSRPNVMKSMQAMCNINNMKKKPEEKREELEQHLQYHQH